MLTFEYCIQQVPKTKDITVSNQKPSGYAKTWKQKKEQR